MRALLFVVLPFISSVLADPGELSARSVGFRVPMFKRNKVHSADRVVNTRRLKAITHRSVMKFLVGLTNYESNTGHKHPLANEFSTIKSDTSEQHPVALDLGQSLSARSSLKGSTGSEPLIDSDQGELWYGYMEAGDPGRPFSVQIDTGSSDIFFPSISCNTGCDGHARYDGDISDTAVDLKKNFTLAFEDGSSVFGEQYNDTVSMAGFTVFNQTLGAASTYSPLFNDSNFGPDGLIGLAYPSISVFNATPFFQRLVEDGQVAEPLFSVKLSDKGGELCLGCINRKLYKGDFTIVNVTNQSFWQTDLGGVIVGGHRIDQLNGITCIIDTGSTSIYGDENSMNAIYAQIPGSRIADPKYNLEEGFYTIPCNSSIGISFRFGNKDFHLSSKIINLGNLDNTTCVGGLMYDPHLSKCESKNELLVHNQNSISNWSVYYTK
jgi:cathepsin D